MKDTKLYIVMVGLPARGKTTIATKLKENLMHDSIKARIFNNGELRRKMIRGNTAYAGFFDPGNKEGVALREKIAYININRARGERLEYVTRGSSHSYIFNVDPLIVVKG